MTLADLLTTLETRGALPASRMKDCKTSIKYLAAALGAASPEQCPVDTACQDPQAWSPALEAHFAMLEARGRTIGAVTRRNTRNNLRVVFRLAEAHGLLTAPLPPRLLARPHRASFERQQQQTSPYRTTYRSQTGPHYFGLPQAQWPPDIQTGWRTYQAKCGLRLRETSLKVYRRGLVTYLGYIATICGRTPTWDDVFDVASLAEFVRWHGGRVGRPVSVHGRHVVMMIAAMAKVLKHPHAREVADLRNTLKPPTPMHAKRQHWVSLATIEGVAEAYLAEGRLPFITAPRTLHPGAQRASRFQRGVMLKLLVRIPLRQRNIRELRLGEHLYKDPATGEWQLHLRGDDLKVGTRGGRINEYKLNLTWFVPEFIPVLEEFLQVHRPRLPGSATSPFCFLTQYGRPFGMRNLGGELSVAVSMRTGQRFYPHLIRTIWATEYLESKEDFQTAATMLGDTLTVVMQTYYDVVNKDQHAKAKAFLSTALHTG